MVQGDDGDTSTKSHEKAQTNSLPFLALVGVIFEIYHIE